MFLRTAAKNVSLNVKLANFNYTSNFPETVCIVIKIGLSEITSIQLRALYQWFYLSLTKLKVSL